MNRRTFIKLGGLGAIPVLTQSCGSDSAHSDSDFEIKVESLHTIGHKLTNGFDFTKYPTENIETDYLIVGGGVSGFASLCKLKDKNAILVEANSKPGGTSSYGTYRDIIFSQGAHYDVEYPNNYGQQVLNLLKDLDIIEYDEILQKWSFKEKEYLIAPDRESITYFEDKIVEDPLNITKVEKEFANLMQAYSGKMILPTRLINPKLQNLNNQTFYDFLEREGLVEENLIKSLDYQLIDDYGADTKTVSALAGIHYFACRPYFTENPAIFSPPEGNYYFVRKMMQYCYDKEVWLNSFVYSVEENEGGFEVKIWDDENQRTKIVQTKKVIYSGKKHSLKYIYPDFKFTHDIQYAPWLIVNIILPSRKLKWSKPIWQHDVIGEKGFMGFVDSEAQFDVDSLNRNITAYYCLKPEERNSLLDIFKDPKELVNNTISLIEKYERIELKRIQEVQVKLLGHAMPIPTKNYLFKDMNRGTSNPNFILSGVDNHRLPLLFDAMDAGLNFSVD